MRRGGGYSQQVWLSDVQSTQTADGLEELQITRTKERGHLARSREGISCKTVRCFPLLDNARASPVSWPSRAASHAHWLLPSGAPWASCAAAARRMGGRRSYRRRLSRRTQQLRRTAASSAAPRRRQRVLRSSSRSSGCTNPAPSQIERPPRVAAVSVARPPRCATRRSTAYSATPRRPAATAPSSRRLALLTCDAMQCRSRAVRTGCASRPPAHRACLRRRAARADWPLLYVRRTVRVPASVVPCSTCSVWCSPGGDRRGQHLEPAGARQDERGQGRPAAQHLGPGRGHAPRHSTLPLALVLTLALALAPALALALALAALALAPTLVPTLTLLRHAAGGGQYP